jgi:hypothetical protein
MQLFALGIIGEYLARIFDYSMDRPPYRIGETTMPPAATVPQGDAVENRPETAESLSR